MIRAPFDIRTDEIAETATLDGNAVYALWSLCDDHCEELERKCKVYRSRTTTHARNSLRDTEYALERYRELRDKLFPVVRARSANLRRELERRSEQ